MVASIKRHLRIRQRRTNSRGALPLRDYGQDPSTSAAAPKKRIPHPRPSSPQTRSHPESGTVAAMRGLQLLLGGLLAASSSSLVLAEPQTASIYMQPVGVGSPPPPTLLAEITYDLAPPADDEDGASAAAAAAAAEVGVGVGVGGGAIKAAVTAFEAPELPDDDGDVAAALVRIGVYDAAAGRWASSTSVASAASFGRGYAPHFVLTVLLQSDGGGSSKGEAAAVVVGAACRGVRVDAGATRDFGPQAVVVPAGRGRQPALNRPVVLSAEGKQVPPVEEKTLLQKYWWLAAILVFLLATGGGDGK
ncbi:hypothetical protein RB598_009012 [Gaeumannomyces tritici]